MIGAAQFMQAAASSQGGGGGGGSGGGGVFGPIMSIGGALYNDYRARQAAAEQHDWAKEDAGVNRDWMERMSNTAHFREVRDLRRAGLNPILSATKGPGASTPAGAVADSSMADEGNMDINSGMSNALEARMQAEQFKLMKAQGEQYATAAELNRATAEAQKANAEHTRQEINTRGPKEFIMDKINDWFRSGPSFRPPAASEWHHSIPYHKGRQGGGSPTQRRD